VCGHKHRAKARDAALQLVLLVLKRLRSRQRGPNNSRPSRHSSLSIGCQQSQACIATSAMTMRVAFEQPRRKGHAIVFPWASFWLKDPRVTRAARQFFGACWYEAAAGCASWGGGALIFQAAETSAGVAVQGTEGIAEKFRCFSTRRHGQSSVKRSVGRHQHCQRAKRTRRDFPQNQCARRCASFFSSFEVGD
jgi:hypothetical protein